MASKRQRGNSAGGIDTTSGELEPRRASTDSGGVRRGSATRKSASPIGLPGERVVRETDKTVAVKPPKRGTGRKGPTADAAVDRRKQFSGTNEHADDRRT